MSEIEDLIAARHAAGAGTRATAEEKADARTLTPSQQRARGDAIRTAWYERLNPTSEPEVQPGAEAETDGHQESL